MHTACPSKAPPQNSCMPTWRHIRMLWQAGSRIADTPNILAVPVNLLRQRADRIGPRDQALVEAMMKFKLAANE
jgi:hypothetical protein